MYPNKFGIRRILKYRFLKQSLLREFRNWQRKKPTGLFYEYYVEVETKNLKKAINHPSLGKKLRDAEFSKSGLDIFEYLLRKGLKPHHVCIDYGCGSLRIGQHLIDYLETGNYYGLDVTEHFFNIGRKLLPEKLLDNKRPNLHLIEENILRRIIHRNPDYLFSCGVLLHVPPFELRTFLNNIISLLGPSTIAYIGMAAYRENIQFSSVSWAYSQAYIRQQLLSIKNDLNISFEDFYDFPKETILGQLVIQRGTIVLSNP